MSTLPTPPFELTVEPFVYTSTETKFGQTGYQLLIRGTTLLDPESAEYKALVVTLREASQMAIEEGAEPALLYAPLGKRRGALVQIQPIRDWRGRSGACASALVFRVPSPPLVTAADLAAYFLVNPGNFMTHQTAVKLVEADKTAKACPIDKGARTLQIDELEVPAVSRGDWSETLPLARALWNGGRQVQTVTMAEFSIERLRLLWMLAPAGYRFNGSFLWRAKGDFGPPAPGLRIATDAPVGTRPPFPAGDPEQAEATARLLATFGQDGAKFAICARRVLARPGDPAGTGEIFWQEVRDEQAVEEVLGEGRYLEDDVPAERLAEALHALGRNGDEVLGEWVGLHGAALFARAERFLALLQALRGRRTEWKETIRVLLDRMPAAVASSLPNEGLATLVGRYAKAPEVVDRVILPATSVWLATKPPPPAPTDWSFLDKVKDRTAWAKALTTGPWLNASLASSEVREGLAPLLAGAPERLRRVLWSRGLASGDPELVAWTLAQPALVVALGPEDLEHLPADQMDALAQRLREAFAGTIKPSRETLVRLMLMPQVAPSVGRALRDLLFLQVKHEGWRLSLEELVKVIQNIGALVQVNRQSPLWAEIHDGFTVLLRAHFDIFDRDQRAFEERFLMRVKTELEYFGCDPRRFSNEFSLATAAPAPTTESFVATGGRTKSGGGGGGGGRTRRAKQGIPRGVWIGLVSAGLFGLLLVLFVRHGAEWQASRSSEALRELRSLSNP